MVWAAALAVEGQSAAAALLVVEEVGTPARGPVLSESSLGLYCSHTARHKERRHRRLVRVVAVGRAVRVVREVESITVDAARLLLA